VRTGLRIEERALAPENRGRVVVPSTLVARELREHYDVPDADLSVIPYGVDVDAYHPCRRDEEGKALRTALGIEAGEVVVLFYGHGWARRGLDVLLEALPALRRRRDVHVLVGGHDPAPRAFELLAQRTARGVRPVFLDETHLPAPCLAAADLFVLPTRYDPLGAYAFKALAAGVPVLTTDACGAADLLEPGVHGDVVPRQGGVPALRDALAAWADLDRLAAAAPHARALAEAHSIDAALARLTTLLEELARPAGGST
jgi:UDP-glucose:(heptosyl)LPS alpha-1,3-glucosyltransferase